MSNLEKINQESSILNEDKLKILQEEIIKL